MALLTAWAPELTGPSKPQAFFSIDDLNSNPPVLLGTVIEHVLDALRRQRRDATIRSQEAGSILVPA
jgi:hypothetical protein